MKNHNKRKQAKVHKQRLANGQRIRKHLSNMRNFNVVAVFITKNEAENLPRLMTSLQGFADRVVVVDTGSTDNTVEVATGLGAEVHSIAWPDSFSDARNKAVELANTANATWIAMFDADEILTDGVDLRNKLKTLPANIGVVSIYHRTRFGHRFPRNCIWKPGAAQWKYRFHEHLLPVKPNTQTVLNHYVDHPDDVGKNHQDDRILEMMRLDMVENPESATRKYYFGRQLFYKQDEACLEIFKDVYETSKWQAEAAQAAVFAGNLFEYKRDAILKSEEENKQQLALEASGIAANFYRMAIAKYPKLRGAYVGIIRSSTNEYERLVAGITALKIPQSTFFDDPPKFYDRESNEKLVQIVRTYQHLLQEQPQSTEPSTTVEQEEVAVVGNIETVS